MGYNKTNMFLDKIEYQLELLSEENSSIEKPSCFLSVEQINEHYDKHYKGYLEGYKDAQKRLRSTSFSDESEYRSVLLDLSFNYNGVVLHENYFESLGKSELAKSAQKHIDKSFDGLDNLKKALEGALMSSGG